MSKTGFIHSTDSFGSVDGPGVRFVIFLQGCNMRCRYCHNPDTWELPKIGECGYKQMSPEALIKQALRYKSYWGNEGGITVSGGEPLLQMDFLIDLFKLAKANGISAVLDTAGQPFIKEESFLRKLDELMEYISGTPWRRKAIRRGSRFIPRGTTETAPNTIPNIPIRQSSRGRIFSGCRRSGR